MHHWKYYWHEIQVRLGLKPRRYEVKLMPEAEATIAKLPPEEQEAIRKAMERIAINPFAGHKLTRKEAEELRLSDKEADDLAKEIEESDNANKPV